MNNILGIILVFSGLAFDLLNIFFAWKSAKTGKHKSGIILIPIILYVSGIRLIDIDTLYFRKFILISLGVGVHFLCYFILPGLFSRFFSRS